MPSSASHTTAPYPLSLHDALPISRAPRAPTDACRGSPPPQIATTLSASCYPRPPKTTPRPPRASNCSEASGRKTNSASAAGRRIFRSEEHTSELQSRRDLVCRLLLRTPPPPTLFPYTTLFRSHARRARLLTPAGARLRPISLRRCQRPATPALRRRRRARPAPRTVPKLLDGRQIPQAPLVGEFLDRKSTRLNSSHVEISYAVFCFAHHRPLPSFPTRRSSDLTRAARAY